MWRCLLQDQVPPEFRWPANEQLSSSFVQQKLGDVFDVPGDGDCFLHAMKTSFYASQQGSMWRQLSSQPVSDLRKVFEQWAREELQHGSDTLPRSSHLSCYGYDVLCIFKIIT
jgi:hypothetical protein